MDSPWFQFYPPGVPFSIDVSSFHSLVDLFEQSVLSYPKHMAYAHLGVQISYAELDEKSKSFAVYLQKTLNLPRFSRIAVMLPNVLAYPIVLWGALRAGYAVVNVNPLYTAFELEAELADANPAVLVVLDQFTSVVYESAISNRISHIIVVDPFSELSLFKRAALRSYTYIRLLLKRKLKRLKSAVLLHQCMSQVSSIDFVPVSISPEDIAFLQYTGGTTGILKAALLSHRNIVANVLQIEAWFSGVIKEGQEIALAVLPLYHIFSLTIHAFLLTKIGGFNVLVANPKSQVELLRQMQSYPFTILIGVNTLYQWFLRLGHSIKPYLSHLRSAVGGGMPIQKKVAEDWQKFTGVCLIEGYGLTEAAPCISVNSPVTKEYTGAVGYPLPSTEVLILDEEGYILPMNEVGEIVVRGPQVMQGYWNKKEETDYVFRKEGWLATGDLGFLNSSGLLFLVDRKKDLILVSGFNVYPSEIEQVVLLLPGIVEACVVGIPDSHSGEVPKLFVVSQDASLTEKEIHEHCQKFLTGYKRPRCIEFCSSLPKNNLGKVLRRSLK